MQSEQSITTSYKIQDLTEISGLTTVHKKECVVSNYIPYDKVCLGKK